MTDTETMIDDDKPAEPRKRGRKPGQADAAPRRSAAFSPRAIVKAANEFGFSQVTIDKDGKITLQKSRPADTPAGENGEQNEWDTWAEEVQNKRDQGGE